MNWEQLLNKGRLGHRDAKDETGRTAFLREAGHIQNAAAFALEVSSHTEQSADRHHTRSAHAGHDDAVR